MTRRATYATLAVVFGLVGVLAVIAGAVLAITFGPQSLIRSAPTQLSGPGAAILSTGLRADASQLPIPDGVGTLTIDVTPVGPRALFVGTAAAADLDSYLRGVPYDVVTGLEPGRPATISSIPGGALPKAPASVDFWVAKSFGNPGSPVSLTAERGNDDNWIISNMVPADGVEANVVATLSVSWAWTSALCLLGGGLLALLLAILLTWRWRVARRRAGPAGVPLPMGRATAVPAAYPPADAGASSSAGPAVDDATRELPRLGDPPR